MGVLWSTGLLHILIVIVSVAQSSLAVKHPVVLCHGIIGSILEAKYDIPSSYPLPYSFCPRKRDWTRVWLNALELGLPSGECDVRCLEQRVVNGTVLNVPGVVVRVPRSEQASVYPMDTLDTHQIIKYFAHEFHGMIESLEKNGYVQGRNLFGISYDWRVLPTLDANWVEYAKESIERASNLTGEAVVLVSHSMGGLTAMHFLNRMSEEWRKRYIHHWFSIATPWGGAPVAVKAFISGYNFGLPTSDRSLLGVERSIGAGYALLPSQDLYGNTIFATTKTNNFTSKNYDELFVAMGMNIPQSSFFLQQSLSYQTHQYPTGVSQTCVLSSGVPTFSSGEFERAGSWWRVRSSAHTTGDGTVPALSAAWLCQKWRSRGLNVSIIALQGDEHIALLKSKKVIQILLQLAG